MSTHTHTHTYTHSHTHWPTVGSFVAGWPFALIIENYTWNEGYLFIEICSVTMILLSIYLVLLLLQGKRASSNR